MPRENAWLSISTHWQRSVLPKNRSVLRGTTRLVASDRLSVQGSGSARKEQKQKHKQKQRRVMVGGWRVLCICPRSLGSLLALWSHSVALQIFEPPFWDTDFKSGSYITSNHQHASYKPPKRQCIYSRLKAYTKQVACTVGRGSGDNTETWEHSNPLLRWKAWTRGYGHIPGSPK